MKYPDNTNFLVIQPVLSMEINPLLDTVMY